MKKPAIIFFDIDGTLIDTQTHLMTQRTQDTLKALQHHGIRIALATGRAPMELPEFDGLEFDATLTFNGSLCYSPDQVIWRNPIPAADVPQVIANAADIGRPVSIATLQEIIANGLDDDLREYLQVANITPEVSSRFAQVCRQDVFQMMIGCRPEDWPGLVKNAPGSRITWWWDRAVDVIPVNGGKAAGVRAILDHFHLDPAQAAAFGDGCNDLDMLEAVGTGVAMGNALEELKAAADDICPAVSEEGIWQYCKEKGWI